MYEEGIRHSHFSTEEAKWLFSAAFAPESRTQGVAVGIYYLCVVSELTGADREAWIVPNTFAYDSDVCRSSHAVLVSNLREGTYHTDIINCRMPHVLNTILGA